MIWILKEKNYAVTEYYFSILKEAAEKICDDVLFVDKIDNNKCSPSSDIVIVGTITKALVLFLKGYKNVIVWFQGISPEESYMRNNSIIRKKVLELIEKVVLKKTQLAIFVSKSMKEHYEKKYKIEFSGRYYIMPCFNTELSRESFFKHNKYKNNIFAYTGGLSTWQCFDEILDCYKKIEDLGIPNTKLIVLTPEKEKALEKIKNIDINNYEIGYVKIDELSHILSDVKFGFIIRDNSIVNQVSTPTKISTYVANGLIPILSENIKDFNNVTSEFRYKLCYEADNFYEKIEYLSTSEINPQNVYDEYSKLFNKYYSVNYHVEQLTSKFKQILDDEKRETKIVS